jgi:hypothetical protein
VSDARSYRALALSGELCRILATLAGPEYLCRTLTDPDGLCRALAGIGYLYRTLTRPDELRWALAGTDLPLPDSGGYWRTLPDTGYRRGTLLGTGIVAGGN